MDINLQPPDNLSDIAAVETWALGVQKHFSDQNSFEGVRAVQKILTLIEKKNYIKMPHDEMEQLFLEASFLSLFFRNLPFGFAFRCGVRTRDRAVGPLHVVPQA